MKHYLRMRMQQCRYLFVTTKVFLETLAWSRKVVRRARPISYLADGLLLSCVLVVGALWVV